MLKRPYFNELSVLLFLGLFGTSLASAAVEIRCGKERWLDGPRMNSRDEFQSTLETRCAVVISEEASLNRLKDNLLAGVRKSKTIFSGPTPFQVDGAAGESFDVLIEYREDGNLIQIRQKVLISMSGPQTLIYETKSKSIEAEGMAGYLRKIDVKVQVDQIHPGEFVFTLTNSIRVKCPWYVPNFIFEEKATGIALKNFEKASADDLHRIAIQMLP